MTTPTSLSRSIYCVLRAHSAVPRRCRPRKSSRLSGGCYPTQVTSGHDWGTPSSSESATEAQQSDGSQEPTRRDGVWKLLQRLVAAAFATTAAVVTIGYALIVSASFVADVQTAPTSGQQCAASLGADPFRSGAQQAFRSSVGSTWNQSSTRASGVLDNHAPLARAANVPFSRPGDSNHTLSQQVTYAFHQIITGNSLIKLGFVLLFCTPYVLAAAALYRSLSSESWFDSIYKSYCTLFRTPSSVSRETSVGPALVQNFVFLFGLLVFAVFLGLITEDMTRSLSEIRIRGPLLACRGHTVVCNWNESTPALLRQLANAQKTRKSFGEPVIILADHDRSHMDQDVQRQEGASGRLPFTVQTLRGLPLRPVDLRRACIQAARSVFIMQPESSTVVTSKTAELQRKASASELNAMQASTALYLGSMAPLSGAPHIVMQDSATKGQKIVGYSRELKRGYSGPASPKLLQPLGENVSTALTAQCAGRPGVVDAVVALFTHDPNAEQLYYFSDAGFWGKSYGAVRRRLRDAVALGYLDGRTGATHLNPKDDRLLNAMDKLLVLSKKSKPRIELLPVVKDETIADVVEWMRKRRVDLKDRPRRIIVLNWATDPGLLVESFGEWSSEGTEVVFVGQKSVSIPKRYGNVRFKQELAKSRLDLHALKAAGWTNTDCVLIGPDPQLSDAFYDAQLLADIMVLQEFYTGECCTKRMHIVAPARDPDTQRAVRYVLYEYNSAQARMALVNPEVREMLLAPVVAEQDPSLAQTSRPGTDGMGGLYAMYYDRYGSAIEHMARKHMPCELQPSTSADDSLPMNYVITPELFLPRDFEASLLVHVSQEPALMDVLKELFSQTGQSLHLRSARNFNIDPVTNDAMVSFSWLAEAARLRGETALGIKWREGAMELSPRPDAEFLLRTGDRVIVIADTETVSGRK